MACYLTLTNVVFEYSISRYNILFFHNLTLTNVVFESAINSDNANYATKI